MNETKTTEERDGSTCFYTKGAPQYSWRISAGDHDLMRVAWIDGRAFYEGKDLQGCRITIKLAEVVAIARVTPESIERFQEDDRILCARRLLSGEG